MSESYHASQSHILMRYPTMHYEICRLVKLSDNFSRFTSFSSISKSLKAHYSYLRFFKTYSNNEKPSRSVSSRGVLILSGLGFGCVDPQPPRIDVLGLGYNPPRNREPDRARPSGSVVGLICFV